MRFITFHGGTGPIEHLIENMEIPLICVLADNTGLKEQKQL